MPKGTVFRDPNFRYIDEYIRRAIGQPNDCLGHSNHLYSTDPCWLNDGRPQHA